MIIRFVSLVIPIVINVQINPLFVYLVNKDNYYKIISVSVLAVLDSI